MSCRVRCQRTNTYSTTGSNLPKSLVGCTFRCTELDYFHIEPTISNVDIKIPLGPAQPTYCTTFPIFIINTLIHEPAKT
jgi:hypothetical protein